jgi:hypothetical protein
MAAPAKMASSLEALFADDPEVRAQRQIVASRNQSASGFAREASTKGAKKLGSVQAKKANPMSSLESLWDRT